MYDYPFNQKINLPNPKELTETQIEELRSRWLATPSMYTKEAKKLKEQKGQKHDF